MKDKFFVKWQDTEDPSPVTDHGFQTFDSLEEALDFIAYHSDWLFTLIQGKALKLVQVEEKILRWRLSKRG